MDTSIQRPKFHHWTQQDRDTWTDFLEAFCGSLMEPDMPEAKLQERVMIATRLADTAITEMQYRFFIQDPGVLVRRSSPRRSPRGRRRANSS